MIFLFQFRENALQMVLYALMTFPSTYFDIENCVGRATRAAIDRKKRVRQVNTFKYYVLLFIVNLFKFFRRHLTSSQF